jgi:hypothetical protein
MDEHSQPDLALLTAYAHHLPTETGRGVKSRRPQGTFQHLLGTTTHHGRPAGEAEAGREGEDEGEDLQRAAWESEGRRPEAPKLLPAARGGPQVYGDVNVKHQVDR